MSDPWATTQNTTPAATPAAQYADGSNLEGAYSEQSQLFGGPVLPSSLLNKTHLLGTERTGVIVKAPYDVQSRDFNSKMPKFWAVTPVIGANGRPSKIATTPTDHVTGEKLRPVMDTVIEVQTEYRFSEGESAAVGRDHGMPDEGKRALYVSGDDLKQLRAQIGRLGVRSAEEMVGMKITVKRTGQKPNPGGNASWINTITLSR